MIKLPAIIIIFLPKKWQDIQVKLRRDSMPDSDILDAYKDDTEWIEALTGLYKDSPSPVKDKFQKRLDEMVLPQMRRRGLIDD